MSSQVPMASEHSYALSKISNDYIRATGGCSLCFSPLVFGFELSGAVWVLTWLGCLFSAFFVKTIIKNLTVVKVTDNWIALKSFRQKKFFWVELEEFQLSYYTTWKSGAKGWMQLKLRGAGETLRVESSLSGFHQVAGQAATAAFQNNLRLSATTLSNLDSLGLIGCNGQVGG